MVDVAPFWLLSTSMFLGAFVSGLAGFAFSAAAGVILLHILQPHADLRAGADVDAQRR
jgi:hypothetical protein